MKRCPECWRDYYDDSLLFCLDDGARLLEGPAGEELQTEFKPIGKNSSEAVTRAIADGTGTGKRSTIFSGRRRRPPLYLLAAGMGLALLMVWVGYTYYGRETHNDIRSVAVLPFVNSGNDPELEYLSDGITESLINSLSQIPSLSVKARSSVFTYKGKDVTPQQVANDLSVQTILNGRVRQRGDQVVLNIELVDTSTGNQIWGDQYVQKMTDLVELQSQIARDVSGRLRARLSGDQKQRVAKNFTENTEAYRLYLRGRHHWNKRKPEDIRKSVEYFQQAIDTDPTYALAYAALAEAYILIPNYRLGKPKDYYPKARAAATKAIEIDGSLAEAHNALASVVCNYDWMFADAEREWHKAIELNPNYATAHQWYGEYLLSMGRYGEAVAEMRRAQELDPLSLIINGMVGIALHLDGQWEPALEQLNKTVEIDPNFPRTHLYIAEVYQGLGRFDDATDEFAKHFILNGGSPEDAARLFDRVKNAGKTGREKGHFKAMSELMESAPEGIPPAILAGFWARAGETDRAFVILEKAYRDHDDSLLMLKDYRFDPLKSDPRYSDLIGRVGLTP